MSAVGQVASFAPTVGTGRSPLQTGHRPDIEGFRHTAGRRAPLARRRVARPGKAVPEIVGGLSRRLGSKVGDRLRHPAFR
jgi:hypothetical protein